MNHFSQQLNMSHISQCKPLVQLTSLPFRPCRACLPAFPPDNVPQFLVLNVSCRGHLYAAPANQGNTPPIKHCSVYIFFTLLDASQ